MTQAQLAQRVVRGLLMGRQVDGLFEGGGHLVAVGGHMPNLTVGQPQFEPQIEQQHTSKRQGERVRDVHGSSLGLFV